MPRPALSLTLLSLSPPPSRLTLLNHLTAIHHSDQRGIGSSFTAPGSVGKTPATSNHRQDPLDNDQLFGLPTLQGDEGGLRAYEVCEEGTGRG